MLRPSSRTVTATILAALVAGAVTVLPGASDQVSASAPLNHGKGDRLDTRPVNPACAQQAWPYYDASCLRDPRQPMGRAKSVRIVTTDRISVR